MAHEALKDAPLPGQVAKILAGAGLQLGAVLRAGW